MVWIVFVERLKTNSLFWEEMVKNLKNLVVKQKIPKLFQSFSQKEMENNKEKQSK